MENFLGLLRIRIKRGINLAVRDAISSDPYVVVQMGKQVTFLLQLGKNINSGDYEIILLKYVLCKLWIFFELNSFWEMLDIPKFSRMLSCQYVTFL